MAICYKPGRTRNGPFKSKEWPNRQTERVIPYGNDRLLSDGVERTPIEKIYWGVEADWLQASFDAIEEQYGSVDRYIEVALGIDAETRARIRQNLLK